MPDLGRPEVTPSIVYYRIGPINIGLYALVQPDLTLQLKLKLGLKIGPNSKYQARLGSGWPRPVQPE